MISIDIPGFGKVQLEHLVSDYSGTLSVTTWNRLPIPMSYTATLNGFTQSGGGPLQGGGEVPAAPGNGSYSIDTLDFNLAGVTVVPASVSVSVVGSGIVGGGNGGGCGRCGD